MIQLTEQASQRLKALQAEEAQGAFLRISVKKGGCSGLSYKLDFDTQKTQDDKTFETSGVQIAVDLSSLNHIEGMTLDYDGGLSGKGFTFSNPNAKRSCGCGSSFST